MIHDIDFLVPDKSIKKLMKVIEKKSINHEYNVDWHSLVISKEDLRIEFDPIEWYQKGAIRSVEFSFSGLIVEVINLESLVRIYKNASEVSQDKPDQHRKKFLALKKQLKKNAVAGI